MKLLQTLYISFRGNNNIQKLLAGGAISINGRVLPISGWIESEDPEVLTDRWLRFVTQPRPISDGTAVTAIIYAPGETQVGTDNIRDDSVTPPKLAADSETQKEAFRDRIDAAHAGEEAFGLDEADATHPDGLRLVTLERAAEHTGSLNWDGTVFQYRASIALRTGVNARLDYTPLGQSGQNPGRFSLSTNLRSQDVKDLFEDGKTPTHLELETDANGDGTYTAVIDIPISRDSTSTTFLWFISSTLAANPTELGGTGNIPFRYNFRFSDGTTAYPQAGTIEQKTLSPTQLLGIIRRPNVDQVTLSGSTLSVRTVNQDGTTTTQTYTIAGGGGGGSLPAPDYS